ncbi:hypothetical protein [Streptomyces sp. NPDC091371]|uniref:hypothetical protein n=1 Tax=Streptomyces sp. NPDC091371 TaxID=3155303 RepID=UPI003447E881
MAYTDGVENGRGGGEREQFGQRAGQGEEEREQDPQCPDLAGTRRYNAWVTSLTRSRPAFDAIHIDVLYGGTVTMGL